MTISKLIRRLLIGISLLVIVGALFLWLFVEYVNRPVRLLETSAPDSVSLAWEFYACGNDCPYYRVLHVKNNSEYLGKQVDLRGLPEDFLSWDTEANREKSMNKMFSENFICTGRFERYENRFDECCMDVENLAFVADECRMGPRSDEDRKRLERWIAENIY